RGGLGCMKYRVLAPDGLDYPTDAAIIRRLLAGEEAPWGERKTKPADRGAQADPSPNASLTGLREQQPMEAGAYKGAARRDDCAADARPRPPARAAATPRRSTTRRARPVAASATRRSARSTSAVGPA